MGQVNADSTLLAITGITIPDYAIRGLTFDLQLVTAERRPAPHHQW